MVHKSGGVNEGYITRKVGGKHRFLQVIPVVMYVAVSRRAHMYALVLRSRRETQGSGFFGVPSGILVDAHCCIPRRGSLRLKCAEWLP